LICPGVALLVFGMFLVDLGPVHNGLVARFSLVYFLFLAPLVRVQLKALVILFILNRKLLHAPSLSAAAV
jgi:hypothetical protein